MLNTTMNIEDGELLVTLEGKLDSQTAEEFENDLEEALNGDDKVTSITIDCEGLEYISSAGLRTILAAEQYMEENDYDDVKVINANELITSIFEETGFTDLVDFIG